MTLLYQSMASENREVITCPFLREFIDGKKINPTIQIIDWNNVDNNSFLYTEEMTVQRTGGVGSSSYDSRRPDIVCFVNGLPFAVIEAKRPDGHVKKTPTIE